MILDFPTVKIPEFIARLCLQPISNTRQGQGIVFDLIQKDPFLKRYVPVVFRHLKPDMDLLTIIATLGVQGIRNYIGQLYLSHAVHGVYFESIELDEIYDVLDFEKRYDFLFSEGSNRIFLLGYFLKLCDITNQKENQIETSFLSIPVDVDEVLAIGHSKNNDPDWLLLVVWFLMQNSEIDDLKNSLINTSGDFYEVINHQGKTFYEKMISDLLKYSFAVNDNSFFTEERV